MRGENRSVMSNIVRFIGANSMATANYLQFLTDDNIYFVYETRRSLFNIESLEYFVERIVSD